MAWVTRPESLSRTLRTAPVTARGRLGYLFSGRGTFLAPSPAPPRGPQSTTEVILEKHRVWCRPSLPPAKGKLLEHSKVSMGPVEKGQCFLAGMGSPGIGRGHRDARGRCGRGR